MTVNRDDYQKRIRDVLIYIRDHIDETISLEKLASIANFSPYHFHRFFCGIIGETVAAYIRRLRLEHAAHQLKYSDTRITDIAYDAGYSNLESFTRAFRSCFGALPSQFREQETYFKKSGIDDIKPLKKGGEMNVEVVSKPERKVAFVRHVGPYEECGAAWGKLCGWAGPKGLLQNGTVMLGLSYDDPQITAPEKIRYDACIEVNGNIDASGEIGVQNIPAGDYALYLHKGPYDKLSESYSRICGEWLVASGKEIKHAPSVEIYLNDPCSTPPEELLVEIQLPLKD